MANMVKIDLSACKGCGLCTVACPKKILGLDQTILTPKGYHPSIVLDMELCVACAMCATICPDSAITVWKEDAP